APSHISDDLAAARDQVRWFPAMVSNHVMDLVERYGFDSEIPAALTDYVKARKFYDYKDHSRVGAKHGEFVTDEICDRFCVLGTPDQAVEKLKELESIGVDQFDLYLMTEGQERELEVYGKEIIPRSAEVAAGQRGGGSALPHAVPERSSRPWRSVPPVPAEAVRPVPVPEVMRRVVCHVGPGAETSEVTGSAAKRDLSREGRER